MKKKLRALWGTTPILNIIYNSRAEKLLGVESDTLVFENYYIASGFTYNFSRYCRSKIAYALLACLVFPYFVLRYDIFHFFADRGILPTRRWKGIQPFELWLLKALGKKVFIYTYGGDVRTRNKTQGLGTYNCCLDCPAVKKACVCDDELHHNNMRRIKKYADEIFSMGDMSEYMDHSINDLHYWPVDYKDMSSTSVDLEEKKNRPVKIVHAPNHRHFKGTKYLQTAVDQLNKEGLSVELVLVEKLSNERARRIYQDADIVAEQFLIGWHGYTAIESMAYGKPVVAYIRKREYLVSPEECPIVDANPENLLEKLRELVLDQSKREALGKQGRAYVENYYSLEAFASRLRRVYERHGLLAHQRPLKDTSKTPLSV